VGGGSFFGERVERGLWSALARSCDPLGGAPVHESVTLGVSPIDDRLWAMWGRGDGTLEPFSGADATSTLRLGTALPGLTGCAVGGVAEAINTWAHEWGPGVLLRDDRSRLSTPTEAYLDGLRLAVITPAVCDLCGPGFYSDGSPPGSTAHRDPPDECLEFACQADDLDPAAAFLGGYVQTFLSFLPFSDPQTARFTVQDFDDYPAARHGFCAWTEPYDDVTSADRLRRCPPSPATGFGGGPALVIIGPSHLTPDLALTEGR
jgi:hypothetical protein